MTVEVWVLVVNNIIDHQWNWSDLVVCKSHIDWRFALVVLVKERELLVKVLIVLVAQESFNRSWIKSQVSDHVLELELQEHFEEYSWIRLSLHECFNLTLSLASVNRLKQKKFSQSNFPNFDLENVIEMGFLLLTFLTLSVLLLQANLSIIVELTSKKQVICWLNLNVIDRS